MFGFDIRLIIAVSSVVVAFGIGLFIYYQGRDSALDEVERANTKAGENAEIWRGTYDSCVAVNGVYDFASGKCRGPAKGSGN